MILTDQAILNGHRPPAIPAAGCCAWLSASGFFQRLCCALLSRQQSFCDPGVSFHLLFRPWRPLFFKMASNQLCVLCETAGLLPKRYLNDWIAVYEPAEGYHLQHWMFCPRHWQYTQVHNVSAKVVILVIKAKVCPAMWNCSLLSPVVEALHLLLLCNEISEFCSNEFSLMPLDRARRGNAT